MRLQKQKDQSVQCTIQDNLTDGSKNGSKPAVSTKKNEHLKSIRKNDTHSKFYS